MPGNRASRDNANREFGASLGQLRLDPVVVIREFTRYNSRVIAGFRHKGLKALYETDSPKKIRTDLVGRVRVVMAILDEAQSLDDLTRPRMIGKSEVNRGGGCG